MSQKRKTILVTLAAAAVIFLSLQVVGGSSQPPGPPSAPGVGGKPESSQPNAEPGSQNPERAATPSRPAMGAQEATVPEVGVVNVVSRSHQANVEGYGQVNPQFNLTLSAQVAGRIQSLAGNFETGVQFREGDTLATIDDTDYKQAVAAASAALEEAKVALEEERLQGKQALSEWQRSGLDGEPSSALVLREPQLAAAEAAVKQASEALTQAKRDLAYTEITSPFNSVVVSRSIQPGSFVQSGAEVAGLYATDIAEISVPLSASQWNNLPPASSLKQQQWPVTLTDMDGLTQWQGVVERVEQHLDTTSRQRSAVVRVAKPLEQSTPLYFGTYVVAKITGRVWDNVWQIPSTAISQKQEVWFVTDNNTLDKFTPSVLFMEGGHAFITPVEGMDMAKIVVRPLNSYLVNTKVMPVSEASDGQ